MPCPSSPPQRVPTGVTEPPAQPPRVSYGVAGCAHILIRKNNNLSKIHMICVFFPDRIYIGIIHQRGLALARRGEEEEKKLNKKKSRQKKALAVSRQDPSAWSCAWQGSSLESGRHPQGCAVITTEGWSEPVLGLAVAVKGSETRGKEALLWAREKS